MKIVLRECDKPIGDLAHEQKLLLRFAAHIAQHRCHRGRSFTPENDEVL